MNEQYTINDNISFNISYNLELAISNLELSYLVNEVGKTSNKEKIGNNMLVASMLDEKMYYNENINIPEYQHNNIVLINNDSNIVPLTNNIQNIDSALTIENNEIQFKIDNNTIYENNNQLKADYTKINLAGHYPGIFKPDNDSFIIENNKITLSNNIKDIINNIDEHIEIMKNVNEQSQLNLDNIMSLYKEYMLYDKKYACNTNIKYPIYYFDEYNNNVQLKLITNNNQPDYYYGYVNYYATYFKLKIKFVFNYQSSNLADFNPFNENNISINISPNNYIKWNKTKSYIYNNGIGYFNKESGNVYGEVYYMCYFDINNTLLYQDINNNIFKETHLEYDIIINYNDEIIESTSLTKVKINLFIDLYKDKHINKIIYHNYDVGFNYDGIGNMTGICMLEQKNKSIFLKYFNNENNYIVNNISKDVLNDELKSIINDEESSNSIIIAESNLNQPIQLPNLLDDIDIYYRNINLQDIIERGSDPQLITNINNINTSNIYKSNIKYCFNSTYNIFGNGLRKGDCYIPSIYELKLFYILGFNFYISYVENEMNTKILYSSSFNVDQENKISKVYGIDFSKIKANQNPYVQTSIAEINIDENGKYSQVNNDINSIYKHISVSLFKLPDFSILNGPEYYVSYDNNMNYEIIDYMTKKDVKIRIKCYTDIINDQYTILKRIKFYCEDQNVKINIQSINKISDNIYEITFYLSNIISEYNDIDMYYQDLDDSFNNSIINNTANKYRRICRISVKNVI